MVGAVGMLKLIGSPTEPEPVERAAIKYLYMGNGPALSRCGWRYSQGKADRRPKDKDTG